MSNKSSILMYSNLPPGGASTTYQSAKKYLSRYFEILEIKEPKYKINNILHYLYIALIKSPKMQRNMLASVKQCIGMIVYQSWLIKTPDITRYFDKPKIYICHETLLEYYDPRHIEIQTMKERIINIIRLPIRWRDAKNIQAKNITIVANSQYSKKLIDEAYSISSEVIYPGIDTKKFTRSYIGDKENQVISIGAINKFKRQDFYLDVISKIPIKIRPKLVLMGNGADEKYLQKLKIKAINLNIDLKVYLNASEELKIQELRHSQMFLFAPISEPFGLVVIEAIASGLPVILYKFGGGYIEVVKDRNGVLLNDLDAGNWAKAMMSILSNKVIIANYHKINTEYAVKALDSENMNKTILHILRKHI